MFWALPSDYEFVVDDGKFIGEEETKAAALEPAGDGRRRSR
jgi:hypothetical protein